MSDVPRGEARVVTPRDLAAAADRLVAAEGPGDGSAGERFLAAAAAHAIDLRHFYAMRLGDGRLGQVCLGVPSTGRTANFYASTPRSPAEADELAAVIDAACVSLGGEVRLAQALLQPGQGLLRRGFEGAGFARIAELAFLSGPMSQAAATAREMRHAAPAWPAGVQLERASSVGDAALARALERTYVGTLDCPALCELRDTRDVVESHRAVGACDPDRWLVATVDGAPEGAALLSACPGEGSVELVYLGLGPSLRGRGLGPRLFAEALAPFERAGGRLTCAVDLRNTPARRLYERFGMRETGAREALVRALN